MACGVLIQTAMMVGLAIEYSGVKEFELFGFSNFLFQRSATKITATLPATSQTPFSDLLFPCLKVS